MKLISKFIIFLFFICSVSSAEDTPPGVPVCADSSDLIEIYEFCIDDQDIDTSSAVDFLNKMIAECPEDEHYIRMVRGACFIKENKLSEALSDYKYFLSSGPSTAHKFELSLIHEEIGTIYLKQERYQDAVQAFTMAIDKLPSYTRNYIYRAKSYKKLGDMGSALADYKEALNTGIIITGECGSCYSPTEVDIYLEISNILEQKGDIQGAFASYEQGLKSNPGSLELRSKFKQFSDMHKKPSPE